MLTDLVLSELKLENSQQLIGWAYQDYRWARFASLSKLVYIAANSDDQVAKKILQDAATSLYGYIKLTLDKTKPKYQIIVFAGGNLSHKDSLLAQILETKIKQNLPNAIIKYPQIEPALAAALLAKNQYIEQTPKEPIINEPNRKPQINAQ